MRPWTAAPVHILMLAVKGAKLYIVAKGTFRRWLTQITSPQCVEQAPRAHGAPVLVEVISSVTKQPFQV